LTGLLTEYPFLKWKDSLDEQSTEKIKILNEYMKGAYKLRVGLFVNGELRGWSFGWQDSADSFYMGASVVDPALRRKGYYSQLVQYILDRTDELGFQSVSSNHILANNAVIIAKLKLGFTIKGIEVDAVHGTLLRLNYHHNELMKKAARFRVGAINELEVLLNLRTDA
jgi:GNAT superfamily N-acetyltransferase